MNVCHAIIEAYSVFQDHWLICKAERLIPRREFRDADMRVNVTLEKIYFKAVRSQVKSTKLNPKKDLLFYVCVKKQPFISILSLANSWVLTTQNHGF
jgi:hypothetical protein